MPQDDTEATIPYLGTFFTDLMRVHTVKNGHLHVREHATRAGEERLVAEGPLLTPESSTHYSLTDVHCANQQNQATW
jgi:hypothetical protein